ncbi:MAG: OsmC family protein [Brooklawnia sp.]|uniref:OsmC family protein n=1 Tax=Brooklawnia sp. TaxID=2699740 RepID=UPI003C72DE1A
MEKFPHRYQASAAGRPDGDPATISSPGLPDLEGHSPPEFDGPAGYWSPETMLVGAVVSCLVATWRSVAGVNKFEWTDLDVSAEGVLDRIDRVTRFTKVDMTAKLTLPAGADRDRAEKLMHKAEAACLVSNSLNAEITLEVELVEG